jgi:hypothetical protein
MAYEKLITSIGGENQATEKNNGCGTGIEGQSSWFDFDKQQSIRTQL